jgi:catechol 2,3-dioxygenase-like lactoylglutathione lyase family enzyme
MFQTLTSGSEASHCPDASGMEAGMAVEFNHTIIWARDSKASARFLAEILGLPAPATWGPFEVVKTTNGVSLDFMNRTEEIHSRHFAFLVSESEFDEIFGRIRAGGLPYWADPARSETGQINHHDGGRGVYFEDPNGHLLEIITRPYGG